jgi:sugar lactone lactonase YvrE
MTVTELPSPAPLFEARVELACGNRLGEGVMWDEREGLLHWVDIDRAEMHS